MTTYTELLQSAEMAKFIDGDVEFIFELPSSNPQYVRQVVVRRLPKENP